MCYQVVLQLLILEKLKDARITYAFTSIFNFLPIYLNLFYLYIYVIYLVIQKYVIMPVFFPNNFCKGGLFSFSLLSIKDD